MRTGVGFFSIILLSFLTFGCASTPEKESNQELRREVDDEVSVGREISAKLLGIFYPNRNKRALEYINLIGQSLAHQSGRPELKFHFAILDTDEANAFSAPGGYVFVTRGLLKAVRSEDELATVLGHEIAHINEKHMYNEIVPKRDVSVSESIVRLLSRGQSDISGAMSQIVSKGMKMLLESGLGMEKENAADEAGSLYASALGYNPTALVPLLKRLSENQTSLKVSKTHPPFPERIRLLEEFLSKNGLVNTTYADQDVLTSRFQRDLNDFQPTQPVHPAK